MLRNEMLVNLESSVPSNFESETIPARIYVSWNQRRLTLFVTIAKITKLSTAITNRRKLNGNIEGLAKIENAVISAVNNAIFDWRSVG